MHRLVKAKGIEDTAFYRWNVLISNNEVGSEPDRFAETVAQFHQANRRRAEEQPRSMLATATHDTKRGEDARSRIDVLSEIPDEWSAAVRRWSGANASAKSSVDGEICPDANDEYLFYQVLIGAWDFAREDRGPASAIRFASACGRIPAEKPAAKRNSGRAGFLRTRRTRRRRRTSSRAPCPTPNFSTGSCPSPAASRSSARSLRCRARC